MCDKNSNLNKAILTQVQEFATTNTTFSVHDITVELRKKANAGSLNLPEFEDNNGQYKYNIPHSSIKNAFIKLSSNGIFTEIGLQLNSSYNQVYFEYNAVPIPPPANQPILAAIQTGPNPIYYFGNSPQTVTSSKKDKQSVESKVSNYLDSHVGKSITVEQIRAGIKCNGWTCAEILEIVKSQFPNTNFNGNYPSKEVVNP